MTDTPGREPGAERRAEQRPRPRRISACPRPGRRRRSRRSSDSRRPRRSGRSSSRPERAAQVVRQSSNARWVGFLAVVVVILFVAIYWFYELGAPLGLTEPRLRGRDRRPAGHGRRARLQRLRGELRALPRRAGRGRRSGRSSTARTSCSPTSTRTTSSNVLTVGGRYVCGDPKSLMPVWADTGNPPGPLNYRQIEELIAFLLRDQRPDVHRPRRAPARPEGGSR